MPAVTITKACAIAKMPKSPIRFAVLARLIGDRKRGLIAATTAPTTRTSTASPTSFFCIHAPRCYPTAMCRIRSSVSSAASSTPAMRPRHITATRSETPITSSMSLEIIMMPTPCDARLRISR
jgi:hypothetical protein